MNQTNLTVTYICKAMSCWLAKSYELFVNPCIVKGGFYKNEYYKT